MSLLGNYAPKPDWLYHSQVSNIITKSQDSSKIFALDRQKSSKSSFWGADDKLILNFPKGTKRTGFCDQRPNTQFFLNFAQQNVIIYREIFNAIIACFFDDHNIQSFLCLLGNAKSACHLHPKMMILTIFGGQVQKLGIFTHKDSMQKLFYPQSSKAKTGQLSFLFVMIFETWLWYNESG